MRHATIRPLALTLALLGAAAPSRSDAQDGGVEGVSQAAILGSDDRQQWYEASAAVQELVQRSTVMLVPANAVGTSPSGEAVLRGPSRAQLGLCADQPYLCEEAVGNCSGTLIDEHTVITAGHCLHEVIRSGERPCNSLAVVFNYRMEGPDQRAQILTERDVYYCHEVLAAYFDERDSRTVGDFAVFTIKRDRRGTAPSPVSAPHTPAPLMRSRPRAGTSLHVVGHPQGLPVKISPGAFTLGSNVNFYSDADIFGGNSGGGTFFVEGGQLALAGVIAFAPFNCLNAPHRKGYCYDARDGCFREDVLPHARNRVNTHFWVEPILEAVCDSSHRYHVTTRPSRLCGTSGAHPPSPPQGGSFGSSRGCSASGGPSADGDPGALGGFIFLLGAALLLGSRRGPLPVRCASMTATAAIAGLVALLTGCSPTAGTRSDDPDPREPVEPSHELLTRDYVASALLAQSARRPVGLDLDGDGEIDNALAELVTTLGELGFDLQDVLDETIASGDYLLLGRFSARSEAGMMRLQQARVDGAPDFTGYGVFQALDAPEPYTLRGTVSHALRAAEELVPFEAEASALPLRFPFGDGALDLVLHRARFEAELGEHEGRAELGGLLTDADVTALLEPVAASFTARVAATPGCPSACDDPLVQMLVLALDRDRDGRVTARELRDNPLLGGALAPDVDVDGDGTPDHFSIGLRVFWVRADVEVAAGSTSQGLSHGTLHKDAALAMCRPNQCATSTTCGACNSTATPGCGWCESLGCIALDRALECRPGEWLTTRSACVDCGGLDAESCSRNGFCGWSTTCNACINDSRCSAIPAACSDLRRARGCD
ncbi:MAG: trypsin-like peptidase domain-containing protein [Myxococcales bacterium]|nr:trypsin-like peptidase domain-containing protein [Myxococcales bacterium]